MGTRVHTELWETLPWKGRKGDVEPTQGPKEGRSERREEKQERGVFWKLKMWRDGEGWTSVRAALSNDGARNQSTVGWKANKRSSRSSCVSVVDILSSGFLCMKFFL